MMNLQDCKQGVRVRQTINGIPSDCIFRIKKDFVFGPTNQNAPNIECEKLDEKGNVIDTVLIPATELESR